MPANIKNDEEFLKILKPTLKKVVEYILDKILEANKEEAIAKYVYAQGYPQEYNRTGEFADAWDKQVHISGHLKHDVEGYTFYNWKSMSIGSDDPHNPHFGQHIGVGGEYKGQDSRAYLADIIYQGMAGDLFGKGYWTKPRNAYNALIKYVGKTRFNKWFIEGCQQNKLPIVASHSVPPSPETT